LISWHHIQCPRKDQGKTISKRRRILVKLKAGTTPIFSIPRLVFLFLLYLFYIYIPNILLCHRGSPKTHIYIAISCNSRDYTPPCRYYLTTDDQPRARILLANWDLSLILGLISETIHRHHGYPAFGRTTVPAEPLYKIDPRTWSRQHLYTSPHGVLRL
jgi:hypothetical protein